MKITPSNYSPTSVVITGGTIDGTPIGGTTPAAGAFTTISASGQFTSTVSNGTAPLVVASTTVVANLNASKLGGATFAAPGTIGGGTPGAATFSGLTLNNGATVSGEISANNTANTTLTTFNGANTSAGNAAGSRISIGNNNTAELLTIDVFGNSHATKANYVDIINQVASVLRFGTNNTIAMTIDAAQATSFQGSLTAATGFGCNSKTAQTAYASGGAAGGTATLAGYGFISAAEFNALVTLVANIRLALVANGIMS